MITDDIRKELDEWMFADGWMEAMKKRPSFNPQVLPDGFYPVNNK